MKDICFKSSPQLPTVLLHSAHYHPISVLMVIVPERGIHIHSSAELSPLLWLSNIWCYVLCCIIHLCSAGLHRVRAYSDKAPQAGVPLKMRQRANTCRHFLVKVPFIYLCIVCNFYDSKTA